MTATVTAEPTDAVLARGGDQPDPALRAVLEALAYVRDPELDERSPARLRGIVQCLSGGSR
jgi:hypothetical protein